MKILGRTMVVIGALMICLLAAGPSSALTYSGAWDPTSSSMFALQISVSPGTSTLYMYDFGNTANKMQVVQDQFLGYNIVYFTKSSNIWYASTSVGSQNLNLGTSPDFGFLVMNGSNMYTSYDLLTGVGLYKLYELKTVGMDVIIAGAKPNPDATPVPEPTTLLMLGFGLTGFALIKMRKKIRADN